MLPLTTSKSLCLFLIKVYSKCKRLIILALLSVESQATFLFFYFFFQPPLSVIQNTSLPFQEPTHAFSGACLALFAIPRAGMSELGLPADRKGALFFRAGDSDLKGALAGRQVRLLDSYIGS